MISNINLDVLCVIRLKPVITLMSLPLLDSAWLSLNLLTCVIIVKRDSVHVTRIDNMYAYIWIIFLKHILLQCCTNCI